MILKLKCVDIVKSENSELAIFEKQPGIPSKELTPVAGKVTFGQNISILITDSEKFGTYSKDYVYNIELMNSPKKPENIFPKKEEAKTEIK